MLEAHIFKKRKHCTVDVNFCCQKGEILALTGESGTGKTTIIRILAGLEKPDSGRILFNNYPWYDDKQKNCGLPTRKRKVGYVFQEHALFPHLSIVENVGFACGDMEKVKDLLSLLGIYHLADSMPHQVSGGEKQRAALAQALASDPQVLLLDEPFSALDHTTRLLLQQVMKRLKESLDIPMVLVTHDRDEADFLGDAHLLLSSEKQPSQISEPAGNKRKLCLPGFAKQPVPCASHLL